MTLPIAYAFGDWRLVPSERRLSRGETPVKLGGRAYETLLALIERRDRTVSKDELLDTVWPRLVVEENNLQVQVGTLRKLLGHPAIATIPGRGYRFTLMVSVEGDLPGSPGALESRPATTGAPVVVPPRLTNLPERLPELIGRDTEVALLCTLLQEHDVVTVAGAGGIGKTRLAQQAAAELVDRYSGGVWWVELATLGEAAELPGAVNRALGVQVIGGRDAIDGVVAALRTGPALLVLDNAEHLLEAVAGFVHALRERSPATKVLLTSQELLRLPNEHVLRMTTLGLPTAETLEAARGSGAVALFVARARAVDPAFQLSAETFGPVVEICGRLDGIALAIELAAARVRLLGLIGLRDRLDERFRVLTAGSRAVLRRHQTLRAGLEWSHSLLTAAEQTVFRRLGVFTGGFALEAAQQVADDEAVDAWDVLEHLGALVDKSLVVVEGDVVPRYRLLETTRLYALEQLAAAGETDAVLERHGRSMAELLYVDPGSGAMAGWKPAERVRRAAEIDNLRAALNWAGQRADDTLAVQLAVAAMPSFYFTYAVADYAERVLPLRARIGPTLPAPLQAAFWLSLAFMSRTSASAAGWDAATRALDAYRALGQPVGHFSAIVQLLAIGARRASSMDLAALVADADRIESDEFPPLLRRNFCWARYRWEMSRGNHEAAHASLLRGLAIPEVEGDPRWRIGLLVFEGANLADTEIALGRVEDGERRARAALEGLDATGCTANIVGHVMDTQMLALALLGRNDEAIALGRRARPLLEREGDDLRLLDALALAASGQGRHSDAALVAGYTDAAKEHNGERRWPNQQAYRDRIQTQLAAALPPQTLAALLGQGRALSRDAAFSHAFGSAA